MLDIKQLFRDSIKPYLTSIKTSFDVEINETEANIDWLYANIVPNNYITYADSGSVPTEADIISYLDFGGTPPATLNGYRTLGNKVMFENIGFSVIDTRLCKNIKGEVKLQAISLRTGCMENEGEVTSVLLPEVEVIRDNSMFGCIELTNVYMPKIKLLGGDNDFGNNYQILGGIIGKTINLTVSDIIMEVSIDPNTNIIGPNRSLKELLDNNTCTVTKVTTSQDYLISVSNDYWSDTIINSKYANPITNFRSIGNIALFTSANASMIDFAFSPRVNSDDSSELLVAKLSVTNISDSCFKYSSLQKLYAPLATSTEGVNNMLSTNLWWCYMPLCNRFGNIDSSVPDGVFENIQQNISSDFTLTVPNSVLTNNNGGEDADILTLRDIIENILTKVLNVIGI